jgi:hypothetical protein
LINFKKAPSHLSDWNELIWRLLVEKGTVNRNKTVTFKFKDGTEMIK